MELSSIEEAMAIAQQRWPGLELRRKNDEEACGPCPICHKATADGWILWVNGRYYCRPGGCEGWLDEDQQHTWTAEERRLRRIEAEQMRQRRKQRELERRLSALERMARCTDHVRYHEQLTDLDIYWWISQGLFGENIDRLQLGVCQHCPTDREHRKSYTIPITFPDGKLWNIRHRIEVANGGDKYRPHMGGLGTQLANVQALQDAEYGVIIEGAKKAVVCAQYGFPTVGVMGKSGKFQARWLNWFPSGPIYIALDPDAQEHAERLGAGIAKTGKQVYVCDFPIKPDDLFIAGGTPAEFERFLRLSRRIH